MNDGLFLAMGHILAKLHALDSPMLKFVTRDERLAEMIKKTAKLAQAFPSFADNLSEFTQNMQHGLLRLPRLNPVVIHGDVHFGQFMLTKDDVLAILDFDGCCYGDPAQDLADLIVDPHLKATEGTNPTYASNGGMLPPEFITVLLTSYREHAHCWVDDKAIVWNGQLQLINKAYRAAITQEVNWMLQVPELIMLATGKELIIHGW